MVKNQEGKLLQNVILEQGFDLMLYGMGSVFVFLTLLVVGTMLMSAFLSRFMPEAELVAVPKKAATVKTIAAVNPKTLAVIQDAIHQHRAKSQ